METGTMFHFQGDVLPCPLDLLSSIAQGATLGSRRAKLIVN